MPKAILTIGPPASGKTTYAKKLCKKDGNWINVNRDDIRFSLTGRDTWSEYKFNHKTEDLITSIQSAMIEQAAKYGKNVIISDTNLNLRTRNGRIQFLKDNGFEVILEEFDVSLETLYRRDAERLNGVGKEVIYQMYQKWLQYKGRRTYTADTSLPKAICVDLDGTLAQMQGRSPYEWHRVGEDALVTPVKSIIQGFIQSGHRLIILSGRDGCCEKETRDWLNKYGICFDALFMRKAEDHRKDVIVKEEIFWENIADKYNVVAVFDDRPSVCRMWHELGLKVFACANPYVEF